MRVLVTGGTGFIGSHLVRSLVGRDHEVYVTGKPGERDPGVTCLHWQEAAAEHFDVVFHQAADNRTQSQDAAAMLLANLVEPMELFRRLSGAGCKKFAYASSTAVYGNSPSPYREDVTPVNPLTAYAVSKLAFEHFAKQFAVESGSTVVGLRYCNVYGPGEDHKAERMSMVGQIVRKVVSGETPRVFADGGQKRDWVWVGDVVDANLAILDFDLSGHHVFNVGSGDATSFNDIIAMANKASGRDLATEYFDCVFKESYQNYTRCDISLIQGFLGWTPRMTIERGIAEYVSSLMKH